MKGRRLSQTKVGFEFEFDFSAKSKFTNLARGGPIAQNQGKTTDSTNVSMMNSALGVPTLTQTFDLSLSVRLT